MFALRLSTSFTCAIALVLAASSCSSSDELPTVARRLGTLPLRPRFAVPMSGARDCVDCVEWGWNEGGQAHRARTGWWTVPTLERVTPEASSVNAIGFVTLPMGSPRFAFYEGLTENFATNTIDVRFANDSTLPLLRCTQQPNYGFGGASTDELFVWVERPALCSLTCSGSSMLRVNRSGEISEVCIPALGPAGGVLHPSLPLLIDVDGNSTWLDGRPDVLPRFPPTIQRPGSEFGVRTIDKGFLPLDTLRLTDWTSRTEGGREYTDIVVGDAGWERVPSIVGGDDFRNSSVVELEPGVLGVMSLTYDNQWRFRRIDHGVTTTNVVWNQPALERVVIGVVGGVVVLFGLVQPRADAGESFEWWAWAPEAS